MTGIWLFRLVAGWLIAAPLAAAVEASGVGRLEHGDAVLFEPGGLMLLETLRLAQAGLAAALQVSLWTLLLLVPLTLWVVAAKMVALSSDMPMTLSELLKRGALIWPTFFKMAAVVLVFQVSILSLGTIILLTFDELLQTLENEAIATVVQLIAVCLMGLLVVWIGVVHDLGRAHSIRTGESARTSLQHGFSLFLLKPRQVLTHYVTFGVWSLVTVLAAAAVVGHLNVSSGSELSYYSSWLFHQLAIATLIVLRAAWLQAALRLDA